MSQSILQPNIKENQSFSQIMTHKQIDLFTECETCYLFLDESGTPEIQDNSSDVFVLCCVKIEKNYYDKVFRKSVLKFKTKHNIENLILHSVDIRKQRKGFDFLKGKKQEKARNDFFEEITILVQDLDFEVYYFSVKKDEIEEGLDIYWFAMREVFLMIKNNICKTNYVEKVICESRNEYQNQEILASYKAFHQTLLFEKEETTLTLTKNRRKFQQCFPKDIEFRPKAIDIEEMAGLEITDLVAFPIMNYIRNNLKGIQTNEKLFENYQLIKNKVKKSYHYNLYKTCKKPSFEIAYISLEGLGTQYTPCNQSHY